MVAMSIRDNWRENQMKFTDPLSFKWPINKKVRIHCSGKDTHEGRLLAVKDDHLILLTGEQHLYFQLHHVKSAVFDTLDNSPMRYQHHSVASNYIDVRSFKDILQKMIYRRVLINQGGPESVSGILTGLLDNHVDLVRGQEVIKVANFHIQTICYDLNEKAEGSKTERSVDKKSEVEGREEIPAKTGGRISSVNVTPKRLKMTTLLENCLAESVQEARRSSAHMGKSEPATPSTQTKGEYPISTTLLL
jgi:small nuclear ribonucleoprotein (snRNP)-like protein